MENERIFEWRIQSEPEKIRAAIRAIRECLDREMPGQTCEERSDLRLIFHELLFNAVLHGNANDASKWVHVRLSVKETEVRGCVADEGQGFDPLETLARLEAGRDLLQETGRGILLVQALADRLFFDQGGRRVTFIKQLKARHG